MDVSVSRILVTALALASLGAAISPASAESLSRGAAIAVEGRFFGKQPRGISGMACLGLAGDAERPCLVINDEEAAAEIALLAGDRLKPTGRAVPIIGKDAPDRPILGRQPAVACPDGVGKPNEADGEGIAREGAYLYLVGSHSCSGGGKFKASSYLVSRIALAGEAIPDRPVVERSWRLSDALAASVVKHAFGKDKASGTNIEGLAVVGDTLYAGLRTPLLPRSDAAGSPRDAVIIPVSIPALFAPGDAPLTGALPAPIRVDLGPGTGIRDLAALANGDLLVLSGPTGDQAEIPYALHLLRRKGEGWTLGQAMAVRSDAKGAKGETAKAETVVVLAEGAGTISVMVLYDNIDEGAPTRHEIILQP